LKSESENGKGKREKGKWKMENGKWKRKNEKECTGHRDLVFFLSPHGLCYVWNANNIIWKHERDRTKNEKLAS
jgi:hypothetical protein